MKTHFSIGNGFVDYEKLMQEVKDKAQKKRMRGNKIVREGRDK